MSSMRSLKAKTSMITVAAIIASLVFAAVAGLCIVGPEVEASSTEKMHLLSENEQRSLDEYLLGLEQAVQMSARAATRSLDGMRLVELGAQGAPAVRSAEQTESLDAYAAQHVAYMEEVFGGVASHTNGAAAYWYCIEPQVSANEPGFFFRRLGKVGFERKAPLDVSALDSADALHNCWYFVPVGLGTPSWVGPYETSLLDDQLTVTYAAPIYKSNVLVGVLGMDILFDTMVDQIDTLKVYESGYACLLDADGHVLYHPEYGVVEHEDAQSNFFGDCDLDLQDSGQEAMFYDHDGERWRMSYSTLRNGMKLVVTAPEAEVQASWLRLVRIVPIIGAIISAAFIPLVLLATRTVTEPLQQLTAAAQRLSSEDYQIELDYHGDDEVGELTDAFRRLRDHLQVYTSDLDDAAYVDELTGVRNRQAYDMYAAQVNDAIAHAGERESVQFALCVFDCLDVGQLSSDFGDEWADESVRTACKLLCRVYSRKSVFRVGPRRFVAFLQERNYANREELWCDVDIWADEINARASEPWLEVRVAKGMATYRAGADGGVTTVLERAVERMEAT